MYEFRVKLGVMRRRTGADGAGGAPYTAGADTCTPEIPVAAENIVHLHGGICNGVVDNRHFYSCICYFCV